MYNRCHFPDAAVRPWEIKVRGPSTFLRGLYHLEPRLVVRKLHEQADGRGVRFGRPLQSQNVPTFVQ
jgi:hypothetical protein